MSTPNPNDRGRKITSISRFSAEDMMDLVKSVNQGKNTNIALRQADIATIEQSLGTTQAPIEETMQVGSTSRWANDRTVQQDDIKIERPRRPRLKNTQNNLTHGSQIVESMNEAPYNSFRVPDFSDIDDGLPGMNASQSLSSTMRQGAVSPDSYSGRGSTMPNIGGGFINGMHSESIVSPLGGNPFDLIVTSHYLPQGRTLNGTTRPHWGIDIRAGDGTPIYSIKDGYVAKIGWDPGGYGHYIIIDHSDVTTLYAHGYQAFPKLGSAVSMGEHIMDSGYSGHCVPPGKAGAHLHFEVMNKGGRPRQGFRTEPIAYLKYGRVSFDPWRSSQT